jgi:hypothetical protein
MNNYCRKLDAPFSIKNVDFISYKKDLRNQVRCSNEIIEQDFHKWLAKTASAKVYWTEVFYLSPNFDHSIHCDGNELDNKVKINFVVGGNGSTMVWYQPVSQDKIIKRISPANTLYLIINPNDTIKVYEESLTGLYIVNVGMFHNVYNKQEDRYCISMAIADLTTDQRLTYAELIERIFHE